MDFCGLADSFARLADPTAKCKHCGSASWVRQDLCMNCLLHSGLADDEGEVDSLDALLGEVQMRDTDWRLGNYLMLEEIGRGGMGVIYRARQKHSKRIVAVKRVLNYHADSQETLARFRREAEAAASLDHPNILPIYEVGVNDGLPFFSMKFASGGSLLQFARAIRGEPRECVALMAKVARAVAYAHTQGILHRDLKPGNVLLDSRGEPLVSDFGLAKWLDTTSNLTRTLTIFGTPGYIAPEQIRGRGEELAPTADIYSLGAILFDLLAARPPFLGDHALAVIKQAEEETAPKLRSLAPKLDRDLETICARCLERDPKARYQSASDLARDLELWLEGRPIVARPVLWPTQLWRWFQRNPKLAGSIAACLVLAGVALTWEIQNRQLGATVREHALATNSVALLPFLNLDTGETNEDLEATLANKLRTSLADVGPVTVSTLDSDDLWLAGTGNQQDIKEASQKSRARLLLTGTTRTQNGKQRISLRLISAESGRMVWKKRIEIPAGSGLPASATNELSSAAHTSFSPDDSKSNGDKDPAMRNHAARDFVISSRQLMLRMTVGDFDRALQCLRRALELEPRSALAHAYFAIAAAGRTHFQPDPVLLAQAEEEARKAVALNPDSATSCRALAGVFYQEQRLSQALEEEFNAIEAEGAEERGASLIGDILIRLGHPARAISWFRMAKHWATLPGDTDASIGDCWALLCDDQRAEDAYHRSMELRPELADGWSGLSHLRLLQGDFSAARAVFSENIARFKSYNDSNHDPDILNAEIAFYSRNYPEAERLYSEMAQKQYTPQEPLFGAVGCRSALGRLKQVSGDAKGGDEILLKELERLTSRTLLEEGPAGFYEQAAIEASLGKTDAALKSLNGAIKNGWLDARSMQLDPRFDKIANLPGFKSCVAAIRARLNEIKRPPLPNQ